MKSEKTTKVKESGKPARRRLAAPVTNHRLETSLWLVSLLQKNVRGLTLKEINKEYDKYMKEKGYPDGPDDRYEFERRTFYNYVKGIGEMLGILIECNEKDGFRYRIIGGMDDRVTQWMMRSFATNEALLKAHNIRNRILLEDIPSGEQYLGDVMEAMRSGRKITFSYRDFDDEEATEFAGADPYCVKLYHQRWYTVVRTGGEAEGNGSELRVFSLDRVESLKVEEETFRIDKGFDAEAFFRHAFGVRVRKGNPVQLVRLRIAAVQMGYFKSLPLHRSQEIVEENEEWSIVTLKVAVTIELVMQIMYYGPLIEVLSPEPLVEEIRKRVDYMAYAYGLYDEYLDGEDSNDEENEEGGEDDSEIIDDDELSEFRYRIFTAMKNLVNEEGRHMYREKEAAETAYSIPDGDLRESIRNHETPESIAESCSM